MGSPPLFIWVAVIQQQTGRKAERAATYRNEGSCRAFADGFRHVVELQTLASLYR